MSKRIFTTEQITNLSANKNVLRCSAKSVTYSHAFKIEAVRRYNEEGIGARQIFKEAGFDSDVIGNDTPIACLKFWRRVFRKIGASALAAERRGRSVGNGKGRPRLKGLTDAEKIKRLELTVLYLKAENDFLAKLRAGLVE